VGVGYSLPVAKQKAGALIGGSGCRMDSALTPRFLPSQVYHVGSGFAFPAIASRGTYCRGMLGDGFRLKGGMTKGRRCTGKRLDDDEGRQRMGNKRARVGSL